MSSPRTCGCRGGVIVPLRPDVKIEADQRRVDPAETTVEATEQVCRMPEQLSLFDEVPER